MGYRKQDDGSFAEWYPPYYGGVNVTFGDGHSATYKFTKCVLVWKPWTKLTSYNFMRRIY